MILRLVLPFLLVFAALSADGVIVNMQFTDYQCLKKSGKDLVIIRALQSTGIVDPTAISNIKTANKAGFLTDVHMLVCPGKSAVTQVNEMIDYLGGNGDTNNRLLFSIQQEDNSNKLSDSIYDGVYGNIWIDVQTNSALGCSWQTKTASQNCDYVKQVVSAIQARGRSAGIFSKASNWKQIVGDNCSSFTKLPVMYVQTDSIASFSDWDVSNKFGSWSLPNVKNYKAQEMVCGSRFPLIYF